MSNDPNGAVIRTTINQTEGPTPANGPSGAFSNSFGAIRYQVGGGKPVTEDTRQGMKPTASFVGNIMRSTTTTNAEGVQSTTQSTAPSIQRGTSGDSTPTNNAPVFKSSTGRALMANEISGTTEVTVGGVTTNVRAAVAAGLLRQNANGIYVSASGDTAGTPKTPAEQLADAQAKETADKAANEPAPEAAAAFDDATEAMLSETIGKIGNLDAQAAVGSVIANGELAPDMVARLATSLGLTAEETVARSDSLKAAFSKQAADAVGANSAEAIWEWARNNEPSKLNTTMREHANKGTVSGYKALAASYYASLGDTKAGRAEIMGSRDAKARGLSLNGNVVMVTLPSGIKTPWRVAVAQGHISPGRG